MKVVQFKTVCRLMEVANLPDDRGVNFTQYTSGRVSLRFMDLQGTYHNYMIERDGTHFVDTERST